MDERRQQAIEQLEENLDRLQREMYSNYESRYYDGPCNLIPYENVRFEYSVLAAVMLSRTGDGANVFFVVNNVVNEFKWLTDTIQKLKNGEITVDQVIVERLERE